VISHSFAFSASRRLKFSYKSILPCTAFPSTLVSMLQLSPPLPVLLLLRVGGLSCLNGYLEVTVQEKLCSGWPGPFVKVEGCCDSSFVCFQCEQTSQVVIKAFFLVLHSPPHLSACWSSPRHYPYFSCSTSEVCRV
jgi:hypothetical protein